MLKITSKKEVTFIFMTKNMNSGSYFLHGLLDQHPEILVMPIAFDYPLIKNWETTNYWSLDFLNLFLDKYFKPMLTEKSITVGETHLHSLSIVKSLKKIFSERSKKLIYNKMRNLVNKHEAKKYQLLQFLESFSKIYKELFLPNQRSYVAILIPLHFMLTNLKKPDNRYMYYQGSFVKLIKKNKRCKLVHMTRDPIANYGSGVYSSNHGGRAALIALLNIYREYFNCIKPFDKYFGKVQFMTLSNEMIHLNPERELKKLSIFIGVNFIQKTMFQTSIIGKIWLGNSAFGKIDTFDVSLRSSKNWFKIISTHERNVIEWLLKDMIMTYGLPHTNDGKNIIKRVTSLLYLFTFMELKKNIKQKGFFKSIKIQIKADLLFIFMFLRNSKLSLKSS